VKDIPIIFGKRGRTTIPLPMRRRLGWQAGDTIRYRLDGDRVIVSRDKVLSQEYQVPRPVAELPRFVQAIALLFGGGGRG
jgi:hypothetical protein